MFISTPYTGHVHPSLNVVESMVRAGHHVTYILTEKWRSEIESRGAKLLAYEQSAKLTPMLRDAYHLALRAGAEYDAIVYDQLFFLGRILGEKLVKPAVRLFASVAVNEKIMADFMQSGGFMGVFRSQTIRHMWTKDVMKGIDGSIADWTNEVASYPLDCNIVFTERWFQPNENNFPSDKYHFVGPSIPMMTSKRQIPWAQLPHPILYVTLGTVSNRNRQFFIKCFRAFDNEKVSVIVSLGNGLPVSAFSKVPSNFHLYSYVPQVEVLSHADVFITHCGLNSVHQAVCAGVPMVAIPISNDQLTNGKRVAELGLGVLLNKRKLTPTILKNATVKALNDTDIKQTVKKAQHQIRQSDAGERAVKEITDYIQSISTQ